MATTRILILEDTETIRRLYRVLFEKSGFTVLALADASRVLAEVKEFKPDLVLADLLMPKIDGYEVIRILRADPETKKLPIMVISNLGDMVSQQRVAYLGGNDFIVKSNFDPHALVSRVRDFLAGKIPKLEVDPKIAGFLEAEERANQEHNKLSPEEKQYA
ncbi:MAG: response regulator [Candidatus Nomurabacteria bacterium]|nr:MAG: response regulator [Candidatus Nomurabacteria bacterium]